MYISKFKIKNYKSYLESSEINLQPGINIITGQNNAGKTALLQALSLKFGNFPHKSSKNLKSKLFQNDKQSSIEICINTPKEEIEIYLFENESQFIIPELHNLPRQTININSFKNHFIPQNCKLQFEYNSDGNIKFISFNDYGQASQTDYVYSIQEGNVLLSTTRISQPDNALNKIAHKLKSRIYFFHAERLNISSFTQGINVILDSNARNLPEVLNILQYNKIKFLRYISYVRLIFPQIHDISIRPINGSQVEIIVWNEDPNNEREDLVVPLSQCGTGIGQILSILYVVLTSDVPHTIIIDEPNSFLHPGACRKLIEILKEHPQHQFIIATHSPSTIAAANPKTINIIQYKDAVSNIQKVDIHELKNQQNYLAEIGAKLSDVFGADNILWVEGKTEEICFPKIIDNTKAMSLMGTNILSVKNTGDFESSNKKLVFDIYKKLSQGKGLMPPAIGFIFDRENKKDKEIQDLEKESNGVVKFLPRKMYENYLINSDAIFKVINGYQLEDVILTSESVNSWIEKNKWNTEYYSEKNNDEEKWLKKVDGAKLLADLFKKLSKNKLEFSKTTHSAMLTEWLLDKTPEVFDEIREILKSTLKI